MNRSILTAFAAALLIGGLAGGARADDRAEIDALYAKLAEALKNKTPEATLALEAPGFTCQGGDGKKITGKEFVQQMKKQNATSKSIKDVNIAVKKADIKGKTAKVTTDFGYTVEVEDREGHMGPKGATHEVSMNGAVKNDLVKTPSGWKFLTMQQGVGKMLVDGKPVSSAPPNTRRVPRK